MRQIGGGEDNVLTWGGLPDKLSELSNPTCEGGLNWQKSAEAIVLERRRLDGEGLNIKEN
jgi:hypothetical protein